MSRAEQAGLRGPPAKRARPKIRQVCEACRPGAAPPGAPPAGSRRPRKRRACYWLALSACPFDEFLAKEGLLAETEDAAIKEIIADQIKIAVRDLT